MDSPLSAPYSKSSFKNTICLFDWWLTKTQTQCQAKNGLGVAGVTSISRQKEALRVFSSAAIAKRYDIFTIETSDDVTIVLKSLINGDKTLQNGFPYEVVKAFMFGFPTDWEQHAEKYCGVDSITETPKERNHVPHEDMDDMEARKVQSHVSHVNREAIEVPKLVVLAVPENIATDPSNDPNLKRNTSGETKGKNAASRIRSSDRLENLKGGQRKSVSKVEMNVSPMAPVVTVTKDNKKPNYLSASTTRSGKKLEVSGGGTVSSLSSDELQEQVAANVVDKQHGIHASIYKKRHKSRKAKSKVVVEADTENENLTAEKAKRKISVTNNNKKSSARKKDSKEENEAKRIVSPESLSVGRSRSGRLLLPTLEFWRNQMPVYDMHGQITGIQENSRIEEQAKGSGSKPQKKRKK